MGFQNDFIEEIRQKADIIEVVSEYVKIELKGKNYIGLCPFHQEKTPSFNVSREKQLYYCFGCGAGGDIFNFVMKIENLPFIEAAKLLAKKYGIAFQEYNIIKKDLKKNKIREQLFTIHELAAGFYQSFLLNHSHGQIAREYFKKRGYSRATIEKFRLGYAPQSWTALFHFLKQKGFEDNILQKSGLVLPRKTEGYYDRFRNRAMFTIFNLRGQPIGFGGRVMVKGDSPKYLNSPETDIFIKNQTLYGLNFAKDEIKRTGTAIMVEGYTDVITAHQSGIENVIASLGTSLTENQAKLLSRFASEVYIAYDADTAGQSATLRGLDILANEGLIVKVIKLPEDTDPDELILNEGESAFRQLLLKAVSLIDFKISAIINKYDIENPQGKVKAVEEILPLFLSLNNEIEKDYFINRVSDSLQISREALEREIEQFIQIKSKKQDKFKKTWHTIEKDKILLEDNNQLFETKFLYAILKMPHTLPGVMELVSPEQFKNLEIRQLFNSIYHYYSIYKDSVDFFSLNTNTLIESMEDDFNRQKALEILFKYQELDIKEDFIEEGLNKIKEYQKTMEMEKILNEIKQIRINGTLENLNTLLIRYHNMIHQDMRKGGC